MNFSQGSGRRRAVKKPRRYRIPLHLEHLEARNLLSNILVTKTTEDTTSQDTQSETSIVLAKNSAAIVVAYNDSEEHTSTNNHFTGFSQSTNGGASFTDLGALPSSSSGDAGDPALAVNNSTGTIYLSTLSYSTGNTLSFYTSTNNGASFGSPVNSAPGFSGSHFLDKDALAVDNASGTGNGVLYQTFNDFANGGFTDNGIFLTRSKTGTSWGPSGGTRITTNGNNVEGSDVTVGPDHAVYVFWWDGNSSSERIMMKKSTNNGTSFGSQVTVATLKTTGTDGDLNLNTGTAGPTPNLYFRSNAFPQAFVNPTNAQDIYVTYDDVGQAAGDKADVYFTESTNGGTTWSTPLRVNNDTTTTDQWQPAMAVTPDGTHLMITWYDRRNDSSNSLIDRYATIGTITNGGATVTFGGNFKVTEPDSGSTSTSFPAVVGQDSAVVSDYMGDYDQVAADNTYFYTTWGDNRLADTVHTNQPDVRFEKITMSGTLVFSPTTGPHSTNSNAAANGSSAPSTGATSALRSGLTDPGNGRAQPFAASSSTVASASSMTANASMGSTSNQTTNVIGSSASGQESPPESASATSTASGAAITQGSVSPFMSVLFLGGSEGTAASTAPTLATPSSSPAPNGLSAFSTSLAYIPSAHPASTPSEEGMTLMGHKGQQVETASEVEALDAVYASNSLSPLL